MNRLFEKLDYLHWILFIVIGCLILLIIYLYQFFPKDKLPKILKLNWPAFASADFKFGPISASFAKTSKSEKKSINWTTVIISSIAIVVLFLLIILGKIQLKSIKIADVEVAFENGGNSRVKTQEFPHKLVDSNKDGKYFIINLTDASSKDTLKFEKGHYTISSFNKNYMASVNAFNKMIEPLKEYGNYKLYIKGSADSLGDHKWKRTFDSSYRYTSFKYHPDTSRYKNGEFFSNRFDSLKFEDSIRNRDLPALRSLFIAEKLSDSYYGFKPPELLEGKVEKQLNPNFRNVTIFLFVEKNSFPMSEIDWLLIRPFVLILFLLLLILLIRFYQKKNQKSIIDK